jgi:O-antigen/teichoic acid export membrane protein
MLILADKAYVFWVGKSIKVPFMLSVAMAFYVVINAWCGIFAQFLNGVGKIKLQLYSGLVGALINIPLAIFLGKYMGISGVVLSTCFLAVIAAVWAPVQYYKLINNTAKGIWNK